MSVIYLSIILLLHMKNTCKNAFPHICYNKATPSMSCKLDIKIYEIKNNEMRS